MFAYSEEGDNESSYKKMTDKRSIGNKINVGIYPINAA